MIVVLRLGHRIPRDERISTHVGLVSRAFGADGMFYTGQKDEGLEKSIKKIAEEWGKTFKIEYCKNGLKLSKEFKKKGFSLIHLTMYGKNMTEKIDNIRKNKNLLIIIGGAQVEREYFEICDYNLGIGNQPHSEVSALAIFLHEYFEGKQLETEFFGKKKIIPSEREKIIET
ncbi:MAG: tRNA (cytidine(56)-2'-O)-methyltransferase [Candidatus Micrarchaeia archaeon]